MTWRLFIDDDADTVRIPSMTVESTSWRDRMGMIPKVAPDTSHLGPWIIARSAAAAIAEIEDRGMPMFISFDHDLRDGQDAIAVVNWIIDRDLDTGFIPEEFSYEAHSGNPVGRLNIREKIEAYLRFRSEQRPAPARR